MPVPDADPPQPRAGDDSLAVRLAQGAGDLLLRTRAQSTLTGRALGAAGDAAAHHWIAGVLREQRPADALLSEEGAADPARVAQRRVWVVDPLDGTREYSEGRDDWAVHICLVVDGVPAASAVCLPASGATYASATYAGAAPPALPARRPGVPRILVSRSRPPEVAVRVARQLGAELVPMGSAGAKTMAVLRGEADAYLHAGGQFEWDSAAPVGVALAAGLHASRLTGEPLRYNQPDPYLPDLVVCRPKLAARLLAAITQETRLSDKGGH
ncbi:3'(2'),5'-bisphosphate nucleotidase CysQ [Kitasatospora sp. NBC_01287]|uniref:3'(2'),5'-bisphosphate nucleotidase CysQ n=1 Tax=Kitasatospora sp. NBC_01287 TaxID=2903573 RepID=UPI00225B80D8|nr:3'(2'),5'-bisphosphate nucleotidase CysQ [Kitasatospora sp. NBC_01287]MCX4746933.1 3'(2'),5'-bisphosphate nucleotidase CysQ [Kitasatospora sp. NBC_01287]